MPNVCGVSYRLAMGTGVSWFNSMTGNGNSLNCLRMVLLSVITEAIILFLILYLWHNIGRQSNEWLEPRKTSNSFSLSKIAILATEFPISMIKFTSYFLLRAQSNAKNGRIGNKK